MTKDKPYSKKIISILKENGGKKIFTDDYDNSAETLCDVRQYINDNHLREFYNLVRNYVLKMDKDKILILKNTILKISPKVYSELFINNF